MTEQEKVRLDEQLEQAAKQLISAYSLTHRTKSTCGGLCWQRTKLTAGFKNEIGEIRRNKLCQIGV